MKYGLKMLLPIGVVLLLWQPVVAENLTREAIESRLSNYCTESRFKRRRFKTYCQKIWTRNPGVYCKFAAGKETYQSAVNEFCENMASDDSVEEQMWQDIKDSKNIGDFELYLSEYPDGKYSALAKLRIAKIKRSKPEKKPESTFYEGFEFSDLRTNEITEEYESQLSKPKPKKRTQEESEFGAISNQIVLGRIPTTLHHQILTLRNRESFADSCIPDYSRDEINDFWNGPKGTVKIAYNPSLRKILILRKKGRLNVGVCLDVSSSGYAILPTIVFSETVEPTGVTIKKRNHWFAKVSRVLSETGKCRVAFVPNRGKVREAVFKIEKGGISTISYVHQNIDRDTLTKDNYDVVMEGTRDTAWTSYGKNPVKPIGGGVIPGRYLDMITVPDTLNKVVLNSKDELKTIFAECLPGRSEYKVNEGVDDFWKISGKNFVRTVSDNTSQYLLLDLYKGKRSAVCVKRAKTGYAIIPIHVFDRIGFETPDPADRNALLRNISKYLALRGYSQTLLVYPNGNALELEARLDYGRTPWVFVDTKFYKKGEYRVENYDGKVDVKDDVSYPTNGILWLL